MKWRVAGVEVATLVGTGSARHATSRPGPGWTARRYLASCGSGVAGLGGRLPRRHQPSAAAAGRRRSGASAGW